MAVLLLPKSRRGIRRKRFIRSVTTKYYFGCRRVNAAAQGKEIYRRRGEWQTFTHYTVGRGNIDLILKLLLINFKFQCMVN